MMEKFADKVGTQVRRSGMLQAGAAPMPANTYDETAKQRDVSMAAVGAKRWATNQDIFWGAPETRQELPPAYFRAIAIPNIGPALQRQDLHTDNLLELPDDATAAIISEFETFWGAEEAFRSYGFLFKRGFLLWGPPGSGKTSCLQLLIKRLITQEKGVVVALDEPGVAGGCLQLVRQIEPKRPMVCILEDFDALIERFGENQYLAILDGEAQVDNVCFVATTNYPERLDKRFVDRPSRFDTIMYIGMPSAAARRAYFEAKDGVLREDRDQLDAWVQASQGFSLAHLKEMIVAVRCFGQSVDAVVRRLEEMHERQPTSEDTPDKVGVGFHVNGRAA